jgi:hypothetical protein
MQKEMLQEKKGKGLQNKVGRGPKGRKNGAVKN